MVDRHLLGDVAIAILLALPAAALVRPQPPVQPEKAQVSTVQQAHAAAVRQSYWLLG